MKLKIFPHTPQPNRCRRQATGCILCLAPLYVNITSDVYWISPWLTSSARIERLFEPRARKDGCARPSKPFAILSRRTLRTTERTQSSTRREDRALLQVHTKMRARCTAAVAAFSVVHLIFRESFYVPGMLSFDQYNNL